MGCLLGGVVGSFGNHVSSEGAAATSSVTDIDRERRSNQPCAPHESPRLFPSRLLEGSGAIPLHG